MSLDELGNFVQKQSFQIDLPQPLLQGSRAVCNDLYDLVDEGMVRGDFPIPGIHEFFDYDRDKRVQL